jgi:ribosomal protein S18 acetylase RimI-like enzyme
VSDDSKPNFWTEIENCPNAVLSPPSEALIRRARGSDHPTVALTLAAAFDRDPITSFCVRTDARHQWAMRVAFKRALDLFQAHDLTFVANDGQGAALWARHDQWQLTFWQEWMLIPLYIRVCGIGRFMRLSHGFDSMKSHHPTEPHYYLYLLGVHPDHQLQGLGSALLCTMLERCDREHMPAYLEASSPRNIPFYKKHGFQVIEEFPFGPSGPPLTAMWRRPGCGYTLLPQG